jgi:hypothetical protein
MVSSDRPGTFLLDLAKPVEAVPDGAPVADAVNDLLGKLARSDECGAGGPTGDKAEGGHAAKPSGSLLIHLETDSADKPMERPISTMLQPFRFMTTARRIFEPVIDTLPRRSADLALASQASYSATGGGAAL